MWLSRHGLDLNTPQGYQKTVDAIRALPSVPEIIVVDTLHRFLDGDENSAQDAKSMLDACAALINEFGCSVVLVHHTGVSNEAQHRARGSSAWRGALDIEISVVPGDTIEIVQRKSKDNEQVTSAVLVAGQEPVKAKKDGPIVKHQKLFENAWWTSGAEDIDGQPYLTRAALTRKLESDGMADRTVKNMINPSYDNKLIGALMMANIIEKHADGWIVIDKVWSSAMVVSRNA